MKIITAYKCEYCGKLMTYPESMRKHELTCMKNPEPTNCFACANCYYALVTFSNKVSEYQEVRLCCDYCGELNYEGYISHNHALKCEHFKHTKERLDSRYSTEHNNPDIPEQEMVTNIELVRKKQLVK